MLAGCTTTTTWLNASKGETDLYADHAECEARAQDRPMGTTNMDHAFRNLAVDRSYNYCMMGKGWRKQN